MLPVSTQLPVPAANVIVQLPPAPLTATVPPGVPAGELTVAVTVVVPPTPMVLGATLIDTVGVTLFTVNEVVPLPLLYLASPP